MTISKVLVENFRNLQPKVFTFSKGINCIFGPNGNGKTNVLEVVSLITNGKSFRKNTKFSQLLSIESDKNEIQIQALLEDINQETVTVSGKISNLGEEWYLNNEVAKKKNLVSSVFINPFESYLFHTSTTFRKQWLDSHLSLISPEYKKTFNKFTKALRFRNSLLQQGYNSSTLSQVLAIDPQIAEYSCEIILRRDEFISELNKTISPTFKKIFEETHFLELKRESVFSQTTQDKVYQFYRHQESKDFKAGLTTQGVHRDDYIFNFDGINSYEFCSLGQQKMSFLSLLFAYIELFRYKFKTYPIVLIDDVSGELDMVRWKNLLNYLGQKPFQALVTTANENFRIEIEKIAQAKSFEIKNGMPHHG